MFAVFVLACLLSYANAVPAFAGGLAKPVVPSMFAGAAPTPPANHSSDTPSDPDCPETDGTIPLYVPDPESCTKYTVCSGGFGQKLECPPGMHFSIATSSCTFPLLANCPLLENVTETISMTDLKGAPGIDPTAYPNMGLTGLPKFGNPAEGIGQLPGSGPEASPERDLSQSTTAGSREAATDSGVTESDTGVEATTRAGLLSKLRRNKFTKITV